jgi:hypothetical protein
MLKNIPLDMHPQEAWYMSLRVGCLLEHEQQGLEHEMIKNILKRSRQQPPKRSTCEHSLSCYIYLANMQINVVKRNYTLSIFLHSYIYV